ncbi:MAG: recombinase family protein [Pirellulales bacterium]|nr:recombinase family protein [Pirellulales bacterium]
MFLEGPAAIPRAAWAIYARYSSRFQHSIEDQVRSCREWAERNGVNVPDKLVFVDERVTGRSSRREDLQNLRAALESGSIDVVIIFSTNRLYRKT